MRTYLDCYPCFLRQALDAARFAGASGEQQAKVLQETLEMLKHCAGADIVITTAQVFGRKAPVIVTADMVAAIEHCRTYYLWIARLIDQLDSHKPGETHMGEWIMGRTSAPHQSPWAESS